MIGLFSIVQVHFVFCQLNFIVLFPFLIKYYYILYIFTVFRLGSDKLVSCFFSCLPKGSVTGCDWSLGGGWRIFHFQLFESILFFVKWSSLYFFLLLYSTNMLCLLLLYLIGFQHALLLFLRRISTVLSHGNSHGMWLLTWEFISIKSVLHFASCIFVPAVITTMQ